MLAQVVAAEANRHEHHPYFYFTNIEDAYAHVGYYLIRNPAGVLKPAHDLFHGTAIPLGARPISGYAPRSHVLVMDDKSMVDAVILGAAPRPITDPRLVIPSSMTLRSRVGQCEDPMHHTTPSDSTGYIRNVSAGRPLDCLPGDWGSINDMGVAIFIGRLIAALKASDGAKVEAFCGDDLLRLVGYNFELFTSVSEECHLNDEGENVIIKRATPYPWEALGVSRGTAVTRTQDGSIRIGQEYASEEPAKDNQLIIPRLTELGGYLGDLVHRVISCPPAALTVETYDTQTPHIGLMEEVQSSDGTYMLRSAKAIIFEKYAIIPVPKQLKAPEDPLGDSSQGDYKSAGDGDDTGEFQWDDSNGPEGRQAQLFDYLAWNWNRYTCCGLVKHSKAGGGTDWFLPDETDLKTFSSAVNNDDYSSLKSKFSMDLPVKVSVPVDFRSGRQNVGFYQSRSVIAQLDDGSLILEDGYGASIKMGGGRIVISAPGDVWVQAGRSIVNWAAFDAVIKAGNCAELTSSKKDVRIKAEHNLFMLGGNAGDHGGVLIESRSPGRASASDYATDGEAVQAHGVVVKSKGAIDVVGSDIYVGLNGQGSTLALDAGTSGRLSLTGTELDVAVSNLFALSAGVGDAVAVMALSPGQATIPAGLFEVGGNMIIAPKSGSSTADLLLGGNLVANGQAVFDGAVVTNAAFAAYESQSVSKMPQKVALENTPQSMGDAIKTEENEVIQHLADLSSLLKDGADAPGNSEYQTYIGFSCRDSVTDLKLDQNSFIIMESRWQQMARLNGASLDTWDEPAVNGPTGSPGMPYPGYTAWNWDSYATISPVDFLDGTAIARNSMSAQGSEPEKVALAGNYPVVLKP